MSDTDSKKIAEPGEKLLILQAELRDLLEDSEAAAGTVQLDQSKVGRLSRMDALQQQAMARAGLEQHKRRLVQVNRALAALEAGDYGYCEECGEPIGMARLQARPESLYCIKCQEALEQDG